MILEKLHCQCAKIRNNENIEYHPASFFWMIFIKKIITTVYLVTSEYYDNELAKPITLLILR